MSQTSTIEWTDATWNPVTGCNKVSPGCKHCYAQTFAERWRGIPGHPYEQGFDLKLWPERLNLPLTWKEPRTIFVNSMSDLFQTGVSDQFINQVFDIMHKANHHVFQVLTKRSERVMEWTKAHFHPHHLGDNGKRAWPFNVWLGVSVENQNYVWRIKHLQQTPAHIKFLSLEPLLGPISLDKSLLEGIKWVIVGGESGHKARLMKAEWVYHIRSQCQKYRVPFFFKQWGAHDLNGNRVGKKAAGRILDGKTWDGMPVLS